MVSKGTVSSPCDHNGDMWAAELVRIANRDADACLDDRSNGGRG